MIFQLRSRSLVFITVAMFAGCSESNKEQEYGSLEDNQETHTRQYEWYLESTTPAGKTEITQTGFGNITNESFVHWNNREWTLESELKLDENGFIASQKITGLSPFGAPIDEAFSLSDGRASWKTVGEKGELQSNQAAFYLPNEAIAFGATGAMVRAALKQPNQEIALLPSGAARVEAVRDVVVDTPGGKQTLTLYGIHGVSFTPSYIWFDEKMNVAAYDQSGWLGMLPKGWDSAVLKQLSEIQSEEGAKYVEALASNLSETPDRPVLFENVDVVDVVNGRLLENHFVLVNEGVIESISPDAPESSGHLTVNGENKTMIPGLWDMHGHFSLSDGILNIAGGITSVRDIGNVHEKIMELSKKYDSGQVIGPTTYRSGFMDKAGPFASGWAAKSLEDALERVDFFADHGYIQIKLYSSIEPEWVAPIAERTHELDMRLSGHIPAFMSAEQAVEAGYDEIQHINMVFLNFLAGDREDTRKQLRFTLYGDEAGALDLESDEVESFVALLRDNNVVVDPTAAIFDTMLNHLPGDPDPTFAPVLDKLPPSVARGFFSPDMDMGEKVDAWKKSGIRQAEMIKKLHDSGVQIVPGSDHLAAFTIHRELELYVEAGISNADVLKIATLDSASVIGKDNQVGSIEEGKHSDLLLLDGNPLEDISAIRRAVLVMKGKTLYRPDHLYEAVNVEPMLPSLDY